MGKFIGWKKGNESKSSERQKSVSIAAMETVPESSWACVVVVRKVKTAVYIRACLHLHIQRLLLQHIIFVRICLRPTGSVLKMTACPRARAGYKGWSVPHGHICRYSAEIFVAGKALSLSIVSFNHFFERSGENLPKKWKLMLRDLEAPTASYHKNMKWESRCLNRYGMKQ